MQTSNTAEMVTISRAEYERFQEQAQVITSLTLQNEWLLEQLKLSKKKLFGRSSEQAEQMVMEQLSFTYVPAGTGIQSSGLEAVPADDGRLELSNNRAERSIKPFVMGRKNWLFANTPGGAQASSVIYSLMETAKENGLDPYRYLLWVLRNAPQLSETNKAWAEKLLPANAPEECYVPHK